ncbi:hypothetical protein ACFL3Q_05215 [Planctomycetota bacterium]
MRTHIEADCLTIESHSVLGSPQINKDSEIKKLKWLLKYSRRLLDQWHQWQTPLGVACAYSKQIREDLVEFYEDPLKRMFIEATYS